MRNTFWNASATYEKQKSVFEEHGQLSYTVEKCSTITPVNATKLIDKFISAHQAKSTKPATSVAGVQSKRQQNALPELIKMLHAMSNSLQVKITYPKNGLRVDTSSKNLLVEPSSSPDHSTTSEKVSASEASTIDDIMFQEMPTTLMQFGVLTPSSSTSNVFETDVAPTGFNASKKRKYAESDDEEEEDSDEKQDSDEEEEEEEDEKPKKKRS